MNKFQEEVLNKHPEIEYADFKYFASEAEDKVKKLGLPKAGCKIKTVFKGANHELYHQREYCLKNCGFKCLELKGSVIPNK